MGDILKSAVVLFLVCTVVTVALAFTNYSTKDVISDRIKSDQESARKEVLTLAEEFKEVENIEKITSGDPVLGMVKEAFTGLKGGEYMGKVFSVESKGYGGIIKITVGIDKDGKVTGVNIGDNNETPGLGSKAKDDKFISQLMGFAPKEPLTVVKSGKSKDEEINAISGATITSKAVVNAVQAAIEVNNKLEEQGES